jgi:hypothetical protein
MKKAFAAVCVVAIGVLLPAFMTGQDCNPACGQGQSCCVTQYSNGTHSAPYCKSGSCYTTAQKQPLKDTKELDATTFKDRLPKASEPKASEASAQNCGSCQVDSDCGSGNSCCYHQNANGTISCNFCKPGSCFTTSTKKNLNNAKELDAATVKQDK